MTKEIKHKAILTIHNLPELEGKEYRQIREWLLKIHRQISILDRNKFSKKTTFRLMK